MSDERWIIVRNWDKFQHYSNRDPTWIKLYTSLNAEDEWRQLTYAERGLLVSLWVEYARTKGRISVSMLTKLSGMRTYWMHLQRLSDAGFITLSASRPLALEEKKKRRKENPPPKPPKPVDNFPPRRANVMPKDPVQAIRTMIHNGVITDDVELEAELKALDLNTQRNTHLAEELRALITQEGT